jgi:hypothetical protein
MSRAQLRVVVTAYDRPDGLAHLHLTAERSALGATCWTPVRATPFGDVRPGYGRPAWPARSIGS